MDQQKEWVTKATADRIRYLRRQKNLSQEELALRSGINPVYFGQIERGQKCPTIDTLYKIALGLQVPAADLLRFDVAPQEVEDASAYAERLIKQIPKDKISQVVKILEDIAGLL